MDDYIHSSQLVGFHISDNDKYNGLYSIDGQSMDFIKESFYNYSSRSRTEQIISEINYRSFGAYANKFQVYFDLLIKGSNDEEYRNAVVYTEFLVPLGGINLVVKEPETTTTGKVKTYVIEND